MKAKDILKWICRESINGEFLNLIEVPKEGDNEWEQNEDWWNDTLGACPPFAIPSGTYLFYYASSGIDAGIPNASGRWEDVDQEIEIPTDRGFDYIYLYKLED